MQLFQDFLFHSAINFILEIEECNDIGCEPLMLLCILTQIKLISWVDIQGHFTNKFFDKHPEKPLILCCPLLDKGGELFKLIHHRSLKLNFLCDVF